MRLCELVISRQVCICTAYTHISLAFIDMRWLFLAKVKVIPLGQMEDKIKITGEIKKNKKNKIKVKKLNNACCLRPVVLD